MSETPRPLQNEEIAQHLAIAEARNDVPRDESMLHRTADEWLANSVGHASEQLVDDSNVLSSESLLADADELSSWLQDDLRTLRGAIANPAIAREAIAAEYARNGGIPPKALSDKLSLEEVHEYLDVLSATNPPENQRDRDLHDASLGIAGSLVDSWKKRQFSEMDEPTDSKVFADLTMSTGNPDVPSLNTHLSREQPNFESRFHEITRGRIQELGKEILDAAGVRERIGTNGSEADSTDEVQRLRQQNARVRVRTDESSTLPRTPRTEILDDNKTEATTEESRLSAAEQAAREGTLLGYEVEGETEAARHEWLATKAKQIKQFSLSPATLNALRADQKALLLPEGGYRDPDRGAIRYKEILAVLNVDNVQTHNPDDVQQLFKNLESSLDADFARAVPSHMRDIRNAHGQRPKATIATTFNTNVSSDGERTFTALFMM
jgi:hypothetical protein